ncbi:unnamed protein product, partial [Natator depressus]
TALHWAAKHGNLEMAEMVAKAGVDVSAKSHVYTIFHGAAVHNQELLIRLLINTYNFIILRHPGCDEVNESFAIEFYRASISLHAHNG